MKKRKKIILIVTIIGIIITILLIPIPKKIKQCPETINDDKGWNQIGGKIIPLLQGHQVYTTIDCIRTIQPVCGSDQKTYDNSCQACRNMTKIKWYTMGKCPEKENINSNILTKIINKFSN